jgi:hypothetical protein
VHERDGARGGRVAAAGFDHRVQRPDDVRLPGRDDRRHVGRGADAGERAGQVHDRVGGDLRTVDVVPGEAVHLQVHQPG